MASNIRAIPPLGRTPRNENRRSRVQSGKQTVGVNSKGAPCGAPMPPRGLRYYAFFSLCTCASFSRIRADLPERSRR